MTEQFLIGAFRSRQAVIRVDGALRRAGGRTRIVSTPRQVAIGCGLSVQFEQDQLPLMRQLAQQEKTTFLGIYRVTHQGGRVQIDPI